MVEEKDENQKELFVLENERKTTTDTLYNMLCATGKPLHSNIQELIKDKLYLVETKAEEGTEKSLYVLGEVSSKDLERYEDAQIYIDGYSDISLENWLNLFGLNEKDKERVSVVY